MRRRNPACWHQDVRLRGRFERGVRNVYPKMTSYWTGRTRKDVVVYTLPVPVPHYDPRQLTITISNTRIPQCQAVRADGPTDSPHRFDKRRLCIWDPDGPASERWVAEDGLLALIEMSRVHLFKEGYWRETGEWLGPQVPHGDPRDAHMNT